jgi:1-acyl-sn-glycerol-3-phosphate acyltransferase
VDGRGHQGAQQSAKREFGWLYPAARLVVVPCARFAWGIKVEGMENLPDGPAILCPNHTSVLDSFVLPSALPRRITFVGKAEYLDDWKTRTLFPALGMIPIDRSGGEAGQRALDLAAEVLGQGELFGIYPEGTRSRDGRLHKGHTGPARLALRTKAPLVPVGLLGTRRIMPPERKFPRLFTPAVVRIGKAIPVDHYGTEHDDHRLALRRITDELMYEIRRLSGQEYVDEYATKRKAEKEVEVPVARSSADVLGNGSAMGSGRVAAAR